LLLVANRMDAKKTATIMGTTRNGEVMLMAVAPCFFQINSEQWTVNSGQGRWLVVSKPPEMDSDGLRRAESCERAVFYSFGPLFG
jgi:hypothetical protein